MSQDFSLFRVVEAHHDDAANDDGEHHDVRESCFPPSESRLSARRDVLAALEKKALELFPGSLFFRSFRCGFDGCFESLAFGRVEKPLDDFPVGPFDGFRNVHERIDRAKGFLSLAGELTPKILGLVLEVAEDTKGLEYSNDPSDPFRFRPVLHFPAGILDEPGEAANDFGTLQIDLLFPLFGLGQFLGLPRILGIGDDLFVEHLLVLHRLYFDGERLHEAFDSPRLQLFNDLDEDMVFFIGKIVVDRLPTEGEQKAMDGIEFAFLVLVLLDDRRCLVRPLGWFGFRGLFFMSSKPVPSCLGDLNPVPTGDDARLHQLLDDVDSHGWLLP